ncbi:trypco2 family protein [Streptomyces sp. NPDC005322]|uniref:trypco2 family protein n=1 Tax=Streptomyces sp. NPDC005322 TaxID=3157032 RepID=UPI0033AF2DF0
MGDSNDAGEDWLDLADAITLLRSQIVEARNRLDGGAGASGVHFTLGEITLELGMELARVKGGDGGLRFSVVGVGGKVGGKYEKAEKTTHKVTVRLDAHQLGGGQVEVDDEE